VTQPQTFDGEGGDEVAEGFWYCFQNEDFRMKEFEPVESRFSPWLEIHRLFARRACLCTCSLRYESPAAEDITFFVPVFRYGSRFFFFFVIEPGSIVFRSSFIF